MEELLKELAGNSPVAVALIIAFWLFNKANERRDRDHAEQSHQRLLTIKEMSDNCHDVQQKSTAAVDRNTEIIGKCAAIMARLDR